MRPVLPIDRVLADQFYVCLMGERRGLKGVIPPLAPHLRDREPAKILVNGGHEGIGVAPVAVGRRMQQPRDVRRCPAHTPPTRERVRGVVRTFLHTPSYVLLGEGVRNIDRPWALGPTAGRVCEEPGE